MRKRRLLCWVLALSALLCLIRVDALQAAACKSQAKFVRDEILVKFKGIRPHKGLGSSVERAAMASLPAEAHQALGNIQGQVKRICPRIGVFCIRIPPRLSVGQAIEALYRSGTVEYAEPNYHLQLHATPNDPQFPEQWSLHNTGQAGGTTDADIDAPAAWSMRISANAVVVALLDTGVDYNHEDLAVNMWKNLGEIPGDGTDNDGNGYIDDIYGWDAINNDGDPMDDNGHGTQCAGIIAAKGNNGVGICGVAWKGKIMALKCASSAGETSIDAALACINYALAIRGQTGCKMIINASGSTESYSQAFYDAIDDAREAGVLFVAAASNTLPNQDIHPVYPACFDLPNIVSVGRSDRYDLPDSAGYGSFSVDLHAPGTDILSAALSNSYTTFSGTSAACAHVTGAAALIWSHRLASEWDTIKGLILNGTENGMASGAFTGKSITEGRLNLSRSLADILLDDPAIFSVTPNRAWVGDTITIKGVNFGVSPAALRFLGKNIPVIPEYWTDTEITAIIPTGLTKAPGRIQVITPGGTSRGAHFAHGKVEALVGHTTIARSCATSAQVGDYVWLFGGCTELGVTGKVEWYRLSDGLSMTKEKWNMPIPVSQAGAAAIDTKVYVVGGYDNNYYYKTLQIFDTVARTWSTGAELPKELFGVAVVSYAGKLYVFGGADGSTVYASTYAYNPGIDTWSSLASMPVATYAAAAAPIGTTGAILVMGGNSSLSSGSEHAVVQEYNVSSGEWALRSNMKKPRAGAGGINYGTKVFCLHGATTNDAYLADSEYYYSGTWRNIIFGSQELFMPLPGRYGNKIFSLCGHNGLNDSNNVWRFTSP